MKYILLTYKYRAFMDPTFTFICQNNTKLKCKISDLKYFTHITEYLSMCELSNESISDYDIQKYTFTDVRNIIECSKMHNPRQIDFYLRDIITDRWDNMHHTYNHLRPLAALLGDMMVYKQIIAYLRIECINMTTDKFIEFWNINLNDETEKLYNETKSFYNSPKLYTDTILEIKTKMPFFDPDADVNDMKSKIKKYLYTYIEDRMIFDTERI